MKYKVEMTDEEIKIIIEFLGRAQLSGKEVPTYAHVHNLLHDALNAKPSPPESCVPADEK